MPLKPPRNDTPQGRDVGPSRDWLDSTLGPSTSTRREEGVDFTTFENVGQRRVHIDRLGNVLLGPDPAANALALPPPPSGGAVSVPSRLLSLTAAAAQRPLRAVLDENRRLMRELRAELNDLKQYQAMQSAGQTAQQAQATAVAAATAARMVRLASTAPGAAATSTSSAGGLSARADDVRMWLSQLRMSAYGTALLAEGFDTLDLVATLTPSDLFEIGIPEEHIRTTLLPAIEVLRARSGTRVERAWEQKQLLLLPRSSSSTESARLLSEPASTTYSGGIASAFAAAASTRVTAATEELVAPASRPHTFSGDDERLVAVEVPCGRLGLELQAGPLNRGALLCEFVPLADNCKSPVLLWSEQRRASGSDALIVERGMQLIGVNGHELLGAPYSVIVALLQGLAAEPKTLWWSSTFTASLLLQEQQRREAGSSLSSV